MPESLKNVILVMNASDILVHPDPSSGPERIALWTETRDRLEHFLPGLLQDLIPPPPPEAEEAAVPAEESTAPATGTT